MGSGGEDLSANKLPPPWAYGAPSRISSSTRWVPSLGLLASRDRELILFQKVCLPRDPTPDSGGCLRGWEGKEGILGH